MKTGGRWKIASVFALRATPRQVAGKREERERGRRSEIGGLRSEVGGLRTEGIYEDRWKMEDRFARTREERERGRRSEIGGLRSGKMEGEKMRGWL